MSPRDVPPAMLRIPPQSAEAEASLLGGLLLSAEALEVCGGIVSADDFYSLENRLVFEAVMALAGAGKPADVVTVFDWLQSAGKAADAAKDAIHKAEEAVHKTGDAAKDAVKDLEHKVDEVKP